ncbi:MAG: 2'-5' RNA ligase family protein [Halobacteriaceae archaeon]
MDSLNVPVPPAVERVADGLAPSLAGFAERPPRTLVLKRLDGVERHRARERVRRALSGAAPVTARVERVGVFRDPPLGSAPVVYLAVESPGLATLHRRLCEHVDPVAGVEGEAYVPHVTVARGWETEHARPPVDDLAGRSVGPVEWTVTELRFHDTDRGPGGTVALSG